MARRTEGDRRREAYRKRVHGWVEKLVSPSRSPCRGVCFRGRPTDANESRRREREFPSTQREREKAEKKRGERARTRTHEDTHGHECVFTYIRMIVAHMCEHQEETHVRAEEVEKEKKRERENDWGRDRDEVRKREAREAERRTVCMYHQKSVPGY